MLIARPPTQWPDVNGRTDQPTNEPTNTTDRNTSWWRLLWDEHERNVQKLHEGRFGSAVLSVVQMSSNRSLTVVQPTSTILCDTVRYPLVSEAGLAR